MTKASAAAIIFFASDSVAQYVTRDDSDETFSFQWHRALSGSVFGIVSTVFLHNWWGCLEGAVGARLPVAQHRFANTMTKVVIDQAIRAPFYIYSYYMVTNTLQTLASQRGLPDAKSPQKVLEETNRKASDMLWPTMMRHWRLWPLVHSFNFYFVPLHHRVLVQNLVLVGWSGCKCSCVDRSIECVSSCHALADLRSCCLYVIYADLSHLNSGGLLTPSEEIEVTAEELEHSEETPRSPDLAAPIRPLKQYLTSQKTEEI